MVNGMRMLLFVDRLKGGGGRTDRGEVVIKGYARFCSFPPHLGGANRQ